MNRLTSEELRKVELTQSVLIALFAGSFLALCGLPFVFGGQWIAALMGG
jgi:hypothetical protein